MSTNLPATLASPQNVQNLQDGSLNRTPPRKRPYFTTEQIAAYWQAPYRLTAPKIA
jgi:hypothetical protein